MKKLNKKGFTLAELLIVVAIIAVLTAIAVPLFVGALTNAEKRVGEANCRAVRGLVISEILSNETAETLTKTKIYWGYGEVNKEGAVIKLEYLPGDDKPTAATADGWKFYDIEATDDGITTVGTDYGAYKKESDTYYVVVKITNTEINKAKPKAG